LGKSLIVTLFCSECDTFLWVAYVNYSYETKPKVQLNKSTNVQMYKSTHPVPVD